MDAKSGGRLAVLAVLGLAYPWLFALLYLLFTLSLGFLALRFESIVLTIVGGLLLGFLLRYFILVHRALRLPEGVELKENDAPGLFKELRLLAGKMNSEMPDLIMLDGSLNAGVMALPSKWLVPGHSKRILLLGLPLVEGMDLDEFRSVLAHELNSFSLDQGKYSRLAWRAFHLWLRIDREVAFAGGLVERVLLGFFAKWYLAQLNKDLIGISGRLELKADARSASLAGEDATVRAMLVHGMLSKKIMHDVTDAFWEKARTLQEPPRGVFKEISNCVMKRPSQEELDAQFERVRKSLPVAVPGHLSMTERIAALGCEKAPSMPSNSGCAADSLLGESRDALREKIEVKWLQDARPSWQHMHDASQGARHALSHMLNVNFKEASALPSMLRRAQLLESAFGSASALRPLEDILDEHPDCAEAKFNLGRIKLALGKDEGAALMREAMESERIFAHLGYDALSSFYRREGLAKELAALDELRKSAPEPIKVDAQLRPVQANIKSSWHLNPPRLKPAELEELVRILSENGNVDHAYLAQILPPDGDSKEPFHALVVVRRFSLMAYRGEDDSALSTELTLPLSKIQSLKVMPFDKCPVTVRMKLKLLKESLIFKV